MPWVVSVAVAVAVGFNLPITDTQPPVYLAHAVVLALLVLTVITGTHRAARTRFDGQATVLAVLVMVAGYGSLGTGNERFFADYAKLVTILASFYIFSLVFKNWPPEVSRLCVALVAGLLISTFAVVGLSQFALRIVQLGVASRLDVAGLGGFNTYAFVIAMGTVAIIYLMGEYRSRPFGRVRVMGLLAAAAYLMVFLLATFSRGGAVTMVVGVGIFVVASRNARDATLLVAAGAIGLAVVIGMLFQDLAPLAQRYTFADDATGTGRTAMWTFLLSEVARSPWGLLLGSGAGSIDYQLANFGGLPFTTIYSAHNAYLDVLVQYGLIGLTAITVFLIKSGRALLRLPRSAERALLLAIFGQICVGSLIDSYYGASQVGWLFGFLGALIWTVGRTRQTGPDTAGI